MHKKFLGEFFVYSTTFYAFFGSRLGPLINYAIGPSTLKYFLDASVCLLADDISIQMQIQRVEPASCFYLQ